MCCVLSCCSYSLASAGNVCWAKPNHGFFSCQQPGAIFFRQAHGRRRPASPRRADAEQARASRVQRSARDACAKTPVFFAVLCLRVSVRMRVAECGEGSMTMTLMTSRGLRNRFSSRCARRAPWRVAQADLRKSARTPLPSRTPRRDAHRVFEDDSDAPLATRIRGADDPSARHGIATPPIGTSDESMRAGCVSGRRKTNRPHMAAGVRSSSPQPGDSALLSPALPAVPRNRPG